jgi:hypothetical protein
MPTIAHLGPHTLSATAAEKFLQDMGLVKDYCLCNTVEEILTRLRNEECFWGALPALYIDGDRAALEMFFHWCTAVPYLEIVGAMPVRPSLFLWGLPDASLEQIDIVLANLDTITVCQRKLFDLGLKTFQADVLHTAEAARRLAETGRANLAVIAPSRAGTAYGLKKLIPEPLNQPPRDTVVYFIGRDPVGPQSPGNECMLAVWNTPSIVATVNDFLHQTSAQLRTQFSVGATLEREWMIYILRGHHSLPPLDDFLICVEEGIGAHRMRVLGSYYLFDLLEC